MCHFRAKALGMISETSWFHVNKEVPLAAIGRGEVKRFVGNLLCISEFYKQNQDEYFQKLSFARN